MPKLSPATELSKTINKLRSERNELATRIAEIDKLFTDLGISTGASDVPVKARRGRKPGSKNAVPAAAVAAAPTGKRRKRGSFEKSGEESVLEFVTAAGKPNALEVNEHWQKEGRGGKADNTLSKLVKEGKIKRLPAKEGERGGRYAAA